MRVCTDDRTVIENRNAGRMEKGRRQHTSHRALVLLCYASATDELVLHLLRKEGSLEDGGDGDTALVGEWKQRRG